MSDLKEQIEKIIEAAQNFQADENDRSLGYEEWWLHPPFLYKNLESLIRVREKEAVEEMSADFQELLDWLRKEKGVAIHTNDGITGTFAWTKDGSGVFVIPLKYAMKNLKKSAFWLSAKTRTKSA